MCRDKSYETLKKLLTDIRNCQKTFDKIIKLKFIQSLKPLFRHRHMFIVAKYKTISKLWLLLLVCEVGH